MARQEGGASGMRLVAYLAGESTPAALRAALAERLPEYMVPSAYVLLAALPLLPNGKVDRGALARLPIEPAPRSAAAAVVDTERPRTALERDLAALFAQALEHDQAGLHDSFFDLGGNSISGAILIARLQERLGEIVHVVALFDHPTIAALAAYLTREHAGAVARIWGEPTVVPDAARVPSVPAYPGQPSLQTVLGPFIENSQNVFRCPLDQTRFPAEGLSYEYQPRVAGKTLDELRNNKLGLSLTDVWLTYDFDPVHGPGVDHDRNYLYADGHVE